MKEMGKLIDLLNDIAIRVRQSEPSDWTVYDTDEKNSAMKIISGSHKDKIYLHNENTNENYILKK